MVRLSTENHLNYLLVDVTFQFIFNCTFEGFRPSAAANTVWHIRNNNFSSSFGVVFPLFIKISNLLCVCAYQDFRLEFCLADSCRQHHFLFKYISACQSASPTNLCQYLFRLQVLPIGGKVLTSGFKIVIVSRDLKFKRCKSSSLESSKKAILYLHQMSRHGNPVMLQQIVLEHC